MNIIIPAAGLGARFKEDNYDKPKPLINVLGTPLIVHVLNNLRIADTDNIYIVYNQNLDAYNFKHVISKACPQLKIHFITLNFTTRGAAETVLCGLNKIENLNEKTIILDCDTFYEDDIIYTAKQDDNSNIFYFKDNSNLSIFSYIKIDELSVVTDIKEKVKISNNACSGAYCFSSGNLLKKYCELTLNSESKSKNEYYMSNVYDLLIKNNEKIIAHKISNFTCLGTPQQLQTYCLKHDSTLYKKRFCFDLDNTLVTYPVIPNDYTTVNPIVKNIKLLKYLHKLGHTIIIHTARKMKTANHNVGVSTKLAYEVVFETLKKYEIPFDEIYFGKPYADFYIDDLSIKPFEHIEKEIGFYNGNVDPRSFNNIEYEKETLVKTTNNYGEIHWYNNMPDSISHLFSKIIEIDDNKIKMERVGGILFSYLFVNNSLTEHNLQLLLDTIDTVHNIDVPNCAINIYDNYVNKITNRFNSFDYSVLSKSNDDYYLNIIEQLKKYEEENRGECAVIHGDLVFSNIFLCENQSIKLIDMRGKIGDIETIYGDKFYDYAKIYQSLIGYDFILNDCDINYTYATKLQKYFERYFVDKFSEKQLESLKYITAGLIFSLIPLHIDKEKQVKYLKLIERLI